MTTPLAPHPWDTYGKPTVRDVELEGIPEPEWTCEHRVTHFDAKAHLQELKSDLMSADFDLDRAQEEVNEAEETIERLQAEIEIVEAALPPRTAESLPWWPT